MSASLRDFLGQRQGDPGQIMLPSPSLHRFLRQIGHGRGVSLLFHTPAVLKRARSVLLAGGPTLDRVYQQHRFEYMPVLSPEQREHLFVSLRGKTIDRFPERVDLNERALEALVKQARAAGHSVVFLEAPIHPRTKELYAPTLDVYRARMEAIAVRLGVPYLDFAWTLSLRPEDFYDTQHVMTTEGRVAYQARLVATLTPHLRTRIATARTVQ